VLLNVWVLYTLALYHCLWSVVNQQHSKLFDPVRERKAAPKSAKRRWPSFCNDAWSVTDFRLAAKVLGANKRRLREWRR